ncbi:hypothetical protein K523DRAFT_234569 [Schizophyllum commune Tattone D]|nr:hypothetical protein K523DRAFT_234569 [Schizophyllum commune Tattone D]
MDSTLIAHDETTERLRFESFKMGGAIPPSAHRRLSSGHRRSHSRNSSVSLSMSMPSIATRPQPPAPTPAPANPPSHDKRNSHHRRRSSVSTRRESAEMMGVSIPDLPTSVSEDNINFGEKDSIRRRALMALEGKADMSFSKVEIPELSHDMPSFEFATKPSFPAAPGYGSKRDSFKLPPSSSSKDQLGTLVEEEEEDEEEQCTLPHSPPPTPVTPTVPAPTRPRPATLALRPLSLTPETIGASPLPTPPSASPSPNASLRQLSLMSERQATPHKKHPTLHLDLSDSPSPSVNRRSSISYKKSSSSGLPTPDMTPTFSDRRFSLTSRSSMESSSTGSSDYSPRWSHCTAPSNSSSVSSSSNPFNRPLSTSEQHFLFKSHNALLARITDLERALSGRSRDSIAGRPESMSSSTSSDARHMSITSDASEPNDEMLRLIADLKAERDELKRDVDGWRVRVGDLDKQMGVLAKRVENERREAWVARSRVAIVEAEKAAAESDKETLARELDDCKSTLASVIEEKESFEKEVEALRAANRTLQQQVEELQEEMQTIEHVRDEQLMNTPKPTSFQAPPARPRGMTIESLDSESSMTDVEADNSMDTFKFGLKSVVEMHEVDFEEEDPDFYEEDNGLAGYEDEDDLQSPILGSSSSFSDDEDDVPRSTQHLLIEATSVPDPQATPTLNTSFSMSERPTHRPSFSRWTFPRGAALDTTKEENDKFFGCLDSDSEVDPLSPRSPTFSFERSKELFMAGLRNATSDQVPFMLRTNLGIADEDSIAPRSPILDVVMEEDEEEEDEEEEVQSEEDEETSEEESEEEEEDPEETFKFGDVAGITITLTPADSDEVQELSTPEPSHEFEDDLPTPKTEQPNPMISIVVTEPEESTARPQEPVIEAVPEPVVKAPTPVKPAPLMEPSDDEDEEVPTTFNFGRPPVRQASPSGIPRVSAKSLADSPRFSTPSPDNSSVTPPPKRAGPTASFIPQPSKSTPTFMRQPARKPFAPNNKVAGTNGSRKLPASHERSACDVEANAVFRSSSSRTRYPNAAAPAASVLMQSVDLTGEALFDGTPRMPSTPPARSILPAQITSPPRISFQTLTNLMSWTSSPRQSPKAAPSMTSSPKIDVDVPVPPPVAQRGFVSRERQLAQLRLRFAQEGRMGIVEVSGPGAVHL